jgi:teichoic acid transport system ATP-binding protein
MHPESIPAAQPPVAIRVADVHVEYEIYENRRAALRHRLVTRQGSGRSIVHALRGVSMDIHEGEAVAIVGSNGSGKSTLLAAMAGFMPIRSGEILVSDEPKLLGIGAALLPGASGYRNIRLGCLALGMPLNDIDDATAEIADFTELGAALERPLRTYSSGMRARLHFAIATSVHPRLLLIDEALAVGDQKFRTKAEGRIDRILAEAGTLVLVSHSAADVRRLCTRAVWIERGQVVGDGPVDEILDRYAKS